MSISQLLLQVFTLLCVENNAKDLEQCQINSLKTAKQEISITINKLEERNAKTN